MICIITVQTNSYQGLVITDGRDSFAVFTYQCGAMTWSGNATIGFNAGGSQYENHPLSGSSITRSIACMNYSSTVWINLLFKLTPNSKQHCYYCLYTIIQHLLNFHCSASIFTLHTSVSIHPKIEYRWEQLENHLF
jgi:hypothetical protein